MALCRWNTGSKMTGQAALPHRNIHALGGTRKQAFDKTGEHYELREVFDAYMRFGGMPGIADVGLDQEKALGYLRVSTQLLL